MEITNHFGGWSEDDIRFHLGWTFDRYNEFRSGLVAALTLEGVYDMDDGFEKTAVIGAIGQQLVDLPISGPPTIFAQLAERLVSLTSPRQIKHQEPTPTPGPSMQQRMAGFLEAKTLSAQPPMPVLAFSKLHSRHAFADNITVQVHRALGDNIPETEDFLFNISEICELESKLVYKIRWIKFLSKINHYITYISKDPIFAPGTICSSAGLRGVMTSDNWEFAPGALGALQKAYNAGVEQLRAKGESAAPAAEGLVMVPISSLEELELLLHEGIASFERRNQDGRRPAYVHFVWSPVPIDGA